LANNEGWQIIEQAATHGLVQGVQAEAQGGDFWNGFATGTVSSFVAGGFNDAPAPIQWGSGAIVGGFISRGTGGSFGDGFTRGLTISILNHVLHQMPKTFTMSVDEYVEDWNKKHVRSMTETEISHLKEFGCVGICMVELGLNAPTFKRAFASFEDAFRLKAKLEEQIRANPELYGENARAIIIGMRYYSRSRSMTIPDKYGRLTGLKRYKFTGKPDIINEYDNFDFGLFDESQMRFIHANWGGRGMNVSNSSINYFQRTILHLPYKAFLLEISNIPLKKK